MWTSKWILYEFIWKACHFHFRFHIRVNEPLRNWKESLATNSDFIRILLEVRGAIELHIFC